MTTGIYNTAGSVTAPWTVPGFCPICNKPFVYIGDPIADVENLICQGHEPKADTKVQYGWVCPKCGRANAIWVATCPCGPDVKTITTTTTTWTNG